MDRYQQLKIALDRYGSTELREYLATNHTDDIKADILCLLKERTPATEEDNDLKAFTMAAMQGLLANSRIEDTDVVIADLAVAFARAALTELSKHQ